MIPIIFTILTVVGLIVSTFVLAQKRKREGITGIKSALSSICLFLVAITNLLAYWLNFSGIVSWGITIALLLIGAYYTKYLPSPEEQSYS